MPKETWRSNYVLKHSSILRDIKRASPQGPKTKHKNACKEPKNGRKKQQNCITIRKITRA